MQRKEAHWGKKVLSAQVSTLHLTVCRTAPDPKETVAGCRHQLAVTPTNAEGDRHARRHLAERNLRAACTEACGTSRCSATGFGDTATCCQWQGWGGQA